MGIKKNINIGVFIESSLYSGGGYQYESKVLSLIEQYHANNTGITFKYFSINPNVEKDYKHLNISIEILSESFLQKIHRSLLSNIYVYKFFSWTGNKHSRIERNLSSTGIDLVYFLSPSMQAIGLANIPYIFTLWDLGHLHNMEFPEFTHNREFEAREYLYSKGLKKAFKVIVDSEYGKKYTMQKYNLDKDRVSVLKFLPIIRGESKDKYIDIKEKYNIKNKYIFYPAQFWPHKNHVYILEALSIINKINKINISVVFSGSDKGGAKHISTVAKKLGVQDLVHFIGFVPDAEIQFIYKQSLALVMPTYLGPTNIPPLEAAHYRTPTCYSDTPYFREQMKDAVFYINLKNPQSLVEKILLILNNKDMVDLKIRNGEKLLDEWKDEDFYQSLMDIFYEYKRIRACWE